MKRGAGSLRLFFSVAAGGRLGYSARPVPKMKSHSGSKKRFRFTATGKVKRKFSHKNHILTKKNADRVRRLRGTTVCSDEDARRITALLPHGRP